MYLIITKYKGTLLYIRQLSEKRGNFHKVELQYD